MSEDRGIILLENGKEKYIIVKDANYKIMLGKGARVVDLKHSPSGHLVMKADDFQNAVVKTGERAYTLHAAKGEPHLLEEYIPEAEMDGALMRDAARARMPAAPAANAASSPAANAASSSSGPAANAATLPPPPPDPFRREEAKKVHTFMMEVDHGHLDFKFEEHGFKDDVDIFNLYMRNTVDSFLNNWFHDRQHPSIPTNGEIYRCVRSIQAKVYQHIQAEADRQKDRRWPTRFDETRGNLQERYDIASADGSD